MTDLAQTVDRRVDQLGVVCSDDSESENESNSLQHLAATSAPSARPSHLSLLNGKNDGFTTID